MWTYLLFFLLSVAFSFLFAICVKRIAVYFSIVDSPSQDPSRKFHDRPTPLLGGWAIYLSTVISIIIANAVTDKVVHAFLTPRQFIGILIAGLVLVIGGTLDDWKHLKPSHQIVWPIAAVGIVIFFGVGAPFITHPFGGVLQLDTVSLTIFTLGDMPYRLTVFSDIFTLLWLMVLMYATKFLDGLDGLASGIGVIGSLMLFGLSILNIVNQPGTALFSLIVAGACLGFLILNRPPAKIYLGEGGSLLVGFLLGLLSIISGSKIATALLVLAFPIMDIVAVIIARIIKRKKIWVADRSHLHYRLVDSGFSQKRVVLLYYTVSAAFGVSALFINTALKFIFFIVAVAFALFLLVYASQRSKRAAQP